MLDNRAKGFAVASAGFGVGLGSVLAGNFLNSWMTGVVAGVLFVVAGLILRTLPDKTEQAEVAS